MQQAMHRAVRVAFGGCSTYTSWIAPRLGALPPHTRPPLYAAPGVLQAFWVASPVEKMRDTAQEVASRAHISMVRLDCLSPPLERTL